MANVILATCSFLLLVLTSFGHASNFIQFLRFDQFSISPLSLKGIKDAGYEKMTLVQEATFPVILKGSFLCSVDGT